ncbi:uncharacterized protein LOC130760578 [Actinidia eriantha]|uniref:uncharacterized protein LOC130760578 n=1 Tax=Actinidia eriantha TaxID=165200 RepID=UPI0025872828|nr:uncharacterized protein LOC130760578 [Actinidia eriantha]
MEFRITNSHNSVLLAAFSILKEIALRVQNHANVLPNDISTEFLVMPAFLGIYGTELELLSLSQTAFLIRLPEIGGAWSRTVWYVFLSKVVDGNLQLFLLSLWRRFLLCNHLTKKEKKALWQLIWVTSPNLARSTAEELALWLRIFYHKNQFRIRRDHILEDAFSQLSVLSEEDLRGPSLRQRESCLIFSKRSCKRVLKLAPFRAFIKTSNLIFWSSLRIPCGFASEKLCDRRCLWSRKAQTLHSELDCNVCPRYSRAASLRGASCGMAAAYITAKDFLLWLRGVVQNIEDEQRMHPHSSFKAFLEVVKSCSLPCKNP